MLLFAAVVSLGTAIFLVGEIVSFGARQRSLAIKRAATYGHIRVSAGRESLRFRERVISPATNRLASIALRLNPRVTVQNVQLRLLSAGLSGRVTPTAYLAAKSAFGIGFLLVGFMFGTSIGFFGALIFPFAFGAAGFALPGIVVSSRARRRRETVRAELPDALDLLAVSVEAGLGFDGAIDKLTNHMDGPLAEEFAMVLGEMRIGESRHDALKKFAERSQTPEVASFTRSIIQADQLGISLGRILKVQAADSRNRRQMAAEEKAMKAPIKMLFPTVLFIFPAMFLVVLGPAVLNLKELF